MKKIELLTSERIILSNSFFKQEGNLLEITIVSEILEKTKLSISDFKDIEFDGDKGTFNPNKNKKSGVFYELSDIEVSHINKRIDELDKENKITLYNFSLISKFKK